MNTDKHSGFDAVVIGGSFAGLAAATYIARARRPVLVIDGGQPRNRFSPAAHGFLGQDGLAPAQILGTAREQVQAYPSVTFRTGDALAIEPTAAGFSVALADGRIVSGRKIVLATGLRDELPPLPGLLERWGRSVLHCPYCHGYETHGGPLGVLGGDPASAHKVVLLRDWGPVTYFTQGGPLPDEASLAAMSARGVQLETTPIRALLGDAPALTGVVLEDGREVRLNGLFVAPRVHQRPVVTRLSLQMDENPYGPLVHTDERRMTSVPGIYAAGDIVRAAHSISFAVADGVTAGVSLHQALVADEISAA